MSAFFHLAGVLPIKEAISLLKKAITKTYSYKGEDVVKKNHDLLDRGFIGTVIMSHRNTFSPIAHMFGNHIILQFARIHGS